MAERRQGEVKDTLQTRRQTTSEQVWVALARCYRSMSSLIEKSFVDEGLNLTDFMLLEALLHKGPMTITKIQAAALLATGSMTAAVDRLESKGLIVRTLSDQDRRARVLKLTQEGTTAIEAAYERHSAQLTHWMDALSAEERATTFACLRKLEKRLRAVDADAPL